MIRNSLDTSVFKISRDYAPDPPAGSVDLQYNSIGRALFSLMHFTAKYVADANVADRIITVGRKTGVNFYPLGSVAYPIAASQTWKIIGSACPLPNTATSSGYLYLPLPDIIFFEPDEWLFFLFEGAQVADQFSDLKLWFKEWVAEE